MKNKNISTQSSQLLNYFNKVEQQWFDIDEAKTALPNSSDGALKVLLSDMVHRGLLMRIKRGVYHLIPYEQDPDSYMPDWHLLAEPLTIGTPHYIGYYSALHVHNLITQPSLKEQIVVKKQLRPSQIEIKGVPFQFIYHNEKHFFGAKKIWIDSFNKVMCSDLEKTIIDCLFKPGYAGGIVEVAKAIFLSKGNLNFNKLYDYAVKFDSQVVIKRLGFLLELLEINTGITRDLHELSTNSYALLDPELPKKGNRNSRWYIQQNLDHATIKSAIAT
ncbi:MAG: transcriptional regulator [Balneolia bacterium]|nr:transcriptional regulator [Balneolia bacterium]